MLFETYLGAWVGHAIVRRGTQAGEYIAGKNRGLSETTWKSC